MNDHPAKAKTLSCQPNKNLNHNIKPKKIKIHKIYVGRFNSIITGSSCFITIIFL
jgi:hypothetical protein